VRDNTLKLLLLAASMTLVTPPSAHAAGLGRLTVLSTLGQPLNAEIELLAVQKGETITGRLASQEVYAQANAQFNNALTGTRVTLERRPNGQQFLRATTPRPIQEPFVELLIEINSEHGRVMRQYTALLDPPGYGGAAAELPAPAAPAVSAAPPSRPATAAAAPYDPTTAPAPAPQPAVAPPAPRKPPAPVPAASSSPREYGPVKPGETLGRIARTVKPEGVTLEQTLVALHRQNPDAFIKKNMNLVKSGKILRVPEANEIASVTQRQAVQEVRLQVADWNAYRGRAADRVATASEGGSVTSGRIGTSVAEPAPESRDTVRLSRGEGKGKGKGSNADRVRALEEEAIAREKALADANARIGQLEQIIKDSQRAVELKTAPPPGVQKGADKAAKAPATAPVPAPAGKAPGAPAVTADKGAPAPAPDVAKPPKVVAEAPKTAEAPPVPKPEADPAAKAKKPPPPAPAPEFDIVKTITEEPLYLAGGLAVLGLGALGFMMAKRRKSADRKARDEDLGRIAPSLGGGGAVPFGAGATADATAAPAAAKPAALTEPTPTPPPRIEPASRPASPPPAAPAATPRSGSATGDDNDLDFNVGMRRGAAAGAATAPPHDTTPRTAVGEPAQGTAMPAAPAGSTPPSAAPPIVTPPPPRAPEPAARPSEPPPRAPEPAARAPEPPARAPEAPAAEPARAPRSAAEVLRAAQTQSQTRAPEPAPPLEPLMPDFSLDASGVTSSAKPEPARAPAPPAKDSNLMDFDLEPLPPVGAPLGMDKVTTEPPPSVDFKLDLADLDVGTPKSTAGGGGGPARDEHWYDVQQKFDLAKAYEEMGDKDGARDILQEVVREGDAEQQEQAKKLLGSLG
jgi:pilus assembly protein FimV